MGVVSIQGPVTDYHGELALRLPLSVGGSELAPFAEGISQIDGEFLIVIIRPWLAEKLGLTHGSLVVVDNHDGKFNITRAMR